MQMHRIDVDDEVFAYLKAKAEPFVDTPNTVLRRELLGGRPGRKAVDPSWNLVVANQEIESPGLPPDTPQALRHIVDVVVLVKEGGKSRSDATALVARRYGVAPQTVFDKYCRQLDLTAAQFDALLSEPELTRLRGILRKKFSRWSTELDATLSRLG